MKYIKDAFYCNERENNANLFEHDLKKLLNNLALVQGGKKYDELTYQDQLSVRNRINLTMHWNTEIDNSVGIDQRDRKLKDWTFDGKRPPRD